MNYNNYKNVNLMTWETNPKLKKKNTLITAVSAQPLKINDTITTGGGSGPGNGSIYTIIEVIETRPSSSAGKIYAKYNTTSKSRV